jgi:hypothetical protein
MNENVLQKNLGSITHTILPRSRSQSRRLVRVGATHEWHLVIANAVEDITFGFLP